MFKGLGLRGASPLSGGECQSSRVSSPLHSPLSTKGTLTVRRGSAGGWRACFSGGGACKSGGGDVTTVMRSLREDREPPTFDSGSPGSTQDWTRLGHFNTRVLTHKVGLCTTRIHMSHMLTRRDIPCKSAFINVTFVSQTKKQTSKSS